MKFITALLLCLAGSLIATVPSSQSAQAQDSNNSGPAPTSQDRKAGFGKPQVVTGTISMILPQQRMVVINVTDPRLAAEVLQSTRTITRQNGQTVSQSDNVTGVTEAPGKAQLTFEVNGGTLIRVKGERATFSDLEMSLNKQVRVRFVPHRSGNVARTVDVGS
jgi:hypothetical protein